ncbi:unnamed protein product [Medioppia subpectinata]|uniref:CHHC U11-48K-type domain-containing protein n=1 Tax=Medioppia subpectinata TaxID=1979941 RepID=A0A7R9LFE9_9ACAR|nr:unnamed protein product [Medioppia subpectinata]CAG2118294.1 unnamed protein product [Medioppia subpectinata]
MATFTQQRDELKTCPYNPLHKVAARRLQMHIVKCSQNPANPQLADCPFNALHKVRPEDLQKHIHECRDNRQVIREIEQSRNRSELPNAAAVTKPNPLPKSSDDWESHIDKTKPQKSYIMPGLSLNWGKSSAAEDPDEEDMTTEEKPFRVKSYVQVQGLKKSDRKKYYSELVDSSKLKAQVKAEQGLEPKDEHREPNTSLNSTSGSLSSPSAVKTEEEDESSIRKPAVHPFRRVGGIGRGLSPSMTSLNRSVQSIGMSNVKRESDGDNRSESTKRFSPDSSYNDSIPF